VSPDTKIQSMVFVKAFAEDQYLLFCTKKGTVKKTKLSDYSNPRAAGIKAIKIESGDELIDVQVTFGTNDVVLATHHGMSVRFHESDVREMGRDTTGVKGIELAPDDRVVGMVVVKREATLLVVTEKGLGKCTHIDEYRVQKRGGGHHHRQPHGEDGERGLADGSAARRRDHDHHQIRDDHPFPGVASAYRGSQHTGSASGEPRRGGYGDGNCARGA
jgi:DNA gyrase/topoisomerase IV subunit A